jgi:hypothetical protein
MLNDYDEFKFSLHSPSSKFRPCVKLALRRNAALILVNATGAANA